MMFLCAIRVATFIYHMAWTMFWLLFFSFGLPIFVQFMTYVGPIATRRRVARMMQ